MSLPGVSGRGLAPTKAIERGDSSGESGCSLTAPGLPVLLDSGEARVAPGERGLEALLFADAIELGALRAAAALDEDIDVDGGEQRLAHAHDLVAAIDRPLGHLDRGGCGGRHPARGLPRPLGVLFRARAAGRDSGCPA